MTDAPAPALDTDARLAHSEERLRAVVDCVVDGIVVIDSAGLIESFNPAAERMFGYASAEVIGRNVNMLMPAPYHYEHDGYIARYLRTGERRIIGFGREVVGMRRDGSVFPMDLAVSEVRLGRERKFTGLVRDITERKRQFDALKAAREVEARFRALVESVQDYAIVMLDPQGRIVSWNSGAERIKGYRAEEILGAHVSRFYPPEQDPRGMAERVLADAARLGRLEQEGWRVRKDGSRFWASVVISAVHDEQGQLSGFAKVTRDLTERKRAEAEMRDREVRLRTLVETSADGIIVFNAQGRIESFNPAAERLFGYRADEVRSRDVRLLAATPREGQARDAVSALQGEVLGRRKDGTQFPIEVALSEMNLVKERLVTAVVRDVSARKQAQDELRRLNESLAAQVVETRDALQRLRETQAQLIQTEKLASLGGMVAGVAHEINTPIGVSVTAASTLEMWLEKLRQQHDSEQLTLEDFERYMRASHESVQLVLRNLQRAAALVHSFKEIAVDQTSDERRPVRLKAYVGEILSSLAPRLKKTPHEVQVVCPDDLVADTFPGALAQIITNFVTNSLMHAFPDGRAGHIELRIEPQAEGLLLRYRDDGVGIRAENLPRIFDPFFTTRRGSGGSGLGLHIVHNLVTQRLGGRIEAVSTEGHGAEFRVYLPRVAPDRAATSPSY